MKLTQQLMKGVGKGRGGACLSALVGLFLLFFSPVTNLSYDLLFTMRPNSAANEVVIVYMDAESHRELRQPSDLPWDRSLHAGLVKKLTQASAKAVVFDILFVDPDQPEATRQLAMAIAANGKVVVGASRLTVVGNNMVEVRMEGPVEAIASVAHVGVSEVNGEGDVVRKLNNPDTFPSLAEAAAEVVEVKQTAHKRERWFNFYGPRGSIPALSYSRVLRDEVSRGMLSNKVVFVGVGSDIPGSTRSPVDLWATPFTKWTGLRSPGVEIQANAFLNLLHKDWLTRLPAELEIVLIISLGFAFGFGFSLLRPWSAVAVALASSLAVAAATVTLTWQMHIWFPWLIASAGQIPCALGCAIVAGKRKQRFDCARDLPDSKGASSFPA